MARSPMVITQQPAITEHQNAATTPTFVAMAAQVDAQYATACALAQQLDYDGPLTEAALVDCVKFYSQRTVEATLNLGKGLLLLKEVIGHGKFITKLEDLGFAYRSAARLMAAASKTSKYANLAHLAKKASSVAVMLEYLTLDDTEASDLLDGGTVAGLTYDEADRMTATQLRQAFRRAKETDAAKDKVLADKSVKLDRMQTEIERLKQGSLLIQVAVADPDQQREQLLRELTGRAASVEMRIRGDLHLAIGAIREHCEGNGDYHSADAHIAGALAAVARALADLRVQWGIGEAPTDLSPEADVWGEINADQARTPAERAALARAGADRMVDDMREGGKTDATIAAMFPAVWAGSRYSQDLDAEPAQEPVADDPEATAWAAGMDAARDAAQVPPRRPRRVAATPPAPTLSGAYADPERPDQVWTYGDFIPAWMARAMAAQGYDPQGAGDVDAFAANYLVRAPGGAA